MGTSGINSIRKVSIFDSTIKTKLIMNLSFKTKFSNGEPTCFIEKIWVSLSFGVDVKADYAEAYRKKIHENWDELRLPPFGLTRYLRPKLHTIREDKHNRWHAGVKIHFNVFNRTKNMFRFAPVIPCVSTQKIEIIRTSDYLNEIICKVDGRILTELETQKLAWNDGFANLIAFWLYFSQGFEGKIIHWTDLKY